MGKTDRIYALEAALKAGTPILDAPSWARQLGVDLRTLQRYLSDLRRSRNLPVYYDPVLRGYRITEPKVAQGQSLLSLLQAVESRPGLSASELADCLRCSPRSFHRHRKDLAKLNLAIINNRGYRVSRDRLSTRLELTALELLILHLGLRLVEAHYTAEAGEAARAVGRKLLQANSQEASADS